MVSPLHPSPPIVAPWASVHRVRAAATLLLVPALGVALETLRVADRATLRGNPGADDFLRDEFGFWRAEQFGYVRLQLLAHLVLTMGAVVVAVVALRTGRWRRPVVVTAALQALVALPGVLWDYTSMHSAPPEWVFKAPLPVPGGRWTSVTYLAVALTAVLLAARREGRRVRA
jgi:hypothetical protein